MVTGCFDPLQLSCPLILRCLLPLGIFDINDQGRRPNPQRRVIHCEQAHHDRFGIDDHPSLNPSGLECTAIKIEVREREAVKVMLGMFGKVVREDTDCLGGALRGIRQAQDIRGPEKEQRIWRFRDQFDHSIKGLRNVLRRLHLRRIALVGLADPPQGAELAKLRPQTIGVRPKESLANLQSLLEHLLGLVLFFVGGQLVASLAIQPGGRQQRFNPTSPTGITIRHGLHELRQISQSVLYLRVCRDGIASQDRQPLIQLRVDVPRIGLGNPGFHVLRGFVDGVPCRRTIHESCTTVQFFK